MNIAKWLCIAAIFSAILLTVLAQAGVFRAPTGPDSIYPEGLIVDEVLEQLDLLTQDGIEPFFLAVGLIKPHLPFACPAKYFDLYDGVELPPTPHPDTPTDVATSHESSEFSANISWI